MNDAEVNKKLLLRWCGWFFLGNALLFWLIGLHYLPAAFPHRVPSEFDFLSSHGRSLMKTFVVLTYIGYLAFLAFVPAVIVVAGIFVFPRRAWVFFLAILTATIAACLLVFDTVTFALYRFHLNGIMLTLIANGLHEQILGFSRLEYATCGLAIIAVVSIEMIGAYCVWLLIQKKKLCGWGKWIGGAISACFYLSFMLVFYSADYQNAKEDMNKAFIDSARFLPFYYDMLGTVYYRLQGSVGAKNGLMMIEHANEGFMIQPPQAQALLHYPLAQVGGVEKKRPLNLLIIAIDAWRFDMLDKKYAPNIFQFAERSHVFHRHSSGGNATGPGIFSLFYSMPSTYWTAMEMQHRSPLIMDELIKNHYQMGIFTSATVRLPPFDRTVFQAIKDLQYNMPGETAYQKDISVTNAFKQFIHNAMKSQRPFFSFLFYDGVHTYCDYKEDLQPLAPVVMNCERAKLTADDDPAPYFNRYKNAVMLVDHQIKEVLDVLKKERLLDHTVVIFTADHGEEFNDNQLGYWGHSSNYTRYQVQTPLIVYWPGERPRQFFHATSHYDIVPTLMKKLFENSLPSVTYSFGKNLYDTTTQFPYLLVSSYIGFGVVEPDRITSVYSQGNFEIQRVNAEPILEAKLNMDTMRHVFKDLRRFYLVH